jgi:outer membrane lipoprotein-sorting protein
MEDKLRNLKKEIDNNVFKDIPFNRNASIKSVLEGAERTRNSRKGYFHSLKKWFPEFMGVLVCAAILFVLVNVGIRNYPDSQTEKPVEAQKETQNNKKNDTVYVPTPKEELYTEVTKEEILKKMFKTAQYFDTAKGEFHLHYAGGGNPMNVTVQYELSIKQNGGYSREFNDETSNINYYQNDKLWRVIEQEKYYISHTNPGSIIANSEENKKFIDIGQYGEVTVISNPVTPPVGVAKESLFPFEMMGNYIDNINDITIEKQNQELLGHNTIVMKVKIKNRSIKNMRFWVDKDTGILVKYETYNSAGDIVDYLSPTKLKINVPVDSKKFIPNLEGYTDYNQVRQEKPSITTGNIDELVPEELKSQWEEAKKKPNETTVLHLNDKWYIFAKKGYLVNYIEVNGTEGKLYLSKTSPQKSQYTYHALAEGYKVDTLKIVYK